MPGAIQRAVLDGWGLWQRWNIPSQVLIVWIRSSPVLVSVERDGVARLAVRSSFVAAVAVAARIQHCLGRLYSYS